MPFIFCNDIKNGYFVGWMLRYCTMYRYARREGRRGVGNGKGVGREKNNKNNNSIYICERRLYFIDDKSKNSVSIPFSLLPF
jgi:hypothetical protein